MFIKLTGGKLAKNHQKKLLELFLLEVAAPSAAALFYPKARLIISYYVELDTCKMFDGQIEPNESYLGETRKGCAAVALLARWLPLAF